VIDRENGEVMFDRPKPTAGCSTNGRRRRRRIYFSNTKEYHTSKLEIPDWSGVDGSRKYWFKKKIVSCKLRILLSVDMTVNCKTF